MTFVKFYLLFILSCWSCSIDAALGSFQQVNDSPFPTGNSPFSVAFSPEVSGNLFAAIANEDSATVSVYAVNTTNGLFSPVNSYATGEVPTSVAFSPEVSGNLFAAVAKRDGTVSIYQVNTRTGEFTPVSAPPINSGSAAMSVAFSQEVSGNLFAAVANSEDNTVSIYTVDTSTGAFTPVSGSPFAAGTFPYSVAFSPEVSGNLFVAVANLGSSNVSVYTGNPTNGSFSLTDSYTTGGGPLSVAFSPEVSGNLFAAVATFGVGVVVYKVNTLNGTFTAVNGSPFSPTQDFISVAFSPEVSGNLFAAAAKFNSNTVLVYTVNTSTGAFTPVSNSPFPTGNDPSSVAFSPEVSGNLFAAVANESSDNVSVYAVELPPTVTSVSPMQGLQTGGTSVSITGTHFTDVTAVLFGGTAATSFTVVNDSQIIAISPAGTGTVDVTVTTMNGTSVITAADQFSYVQHTSITLFISQNVVPFGQSVLLTATVIPSSATGTVSFFDGSSLLGTTPLINGTANFATTVLSVGQHVLTAVYNGNSQFLPSTSSAAIFIVQTVLPPRHLQGFQKANRFATQTDYVNILTWKVSTEGIPAVAYRIYRDRDLTKLVAEISSHQKLCFEDHNRKKNKTYTYYVVSVDQFGNPSEPASVKIKGR